MKILFCFCTEKKKKFFTLFLLLDAIYTSINNITVQDVAGEIYRVQNYECAGQTLMLYIPNIMVLNYEYDVCSYSYSYVTII